MPTPCPPPRPADCLPPVNTWRTCRGQYPTDPARIQPYDETQIGAVYDWIVEETIPCYAELGYVVNDVPSREAFVDQWFASMAHWIPEDGVAGQLPATIDDVCPRIPPADQLYD